MIKHPVRRLGLCTLLFLLCAPFAGGDEGERKTLDEMTLDEIAAELGNPVSALASLDIDLQKRYYQGSLADAGDQSGMVTNFRLYLPKPLDNGRNVLVGLNVPIHGNQPLYYVDRTEIPEYRIRQLADVLPPDETWVPTHDYLGDVEISLAYGGVSDSGFISLYGIKAVLPSTTDLSTGVDQFQLGPEITIGKTTPTGSFGLRARHMTRVSGDSLYDTNMTSMEVFFNHGLGNGWQVFSNPVIQYDWEAAADNKLLLPLGAGLAKTARLGRFPIRTALEIQHYLVSPDSFGPRWLIRLSLTPVFNSPFRG